MTWQPLREDVPVKNGVIVDIGDETLWSNDLYVVHRREMPSKSAEIGDAVHLSIRRSDRQPCRDWRDFQRIKNQLAGPEWEAMEIFPAESRMVDMANQYHLWCFPFELGVGFHQGRMVGNSAQAEILSPGAVQRDPEPVDLASSGGKLTPLKVMKQDVDAKMPNGNKYGEAPA